MNAAGASDWKEETRERGLVQQRRTAVTRRPVQAHTDCMHAGRQHRRRHNRQLSRTELNVVVLEVANTVGPGARLSYLLT